MRSLLFPLIPLVILIAVDLSTQQSAVPVHTFTAHLDNLLQFDHKVINATKVEDYLNEFAREYVQAQIDLYKNQSQAAPAGRKRRGTLEDLANKVYTLKIVKRKKSSH